MIDRKCFSGIVAVIVSVAVIACLVSIAFAEQLSDQIGKSGVSMEYESKLFDTSNILEIDIAIDAGSWTDLLENAINEEYYSCNVSVNGTNFYNVGIRAKGNTSLSSIASDDTTDRYSFKLEFDHYVESQTCFGLDKLVLNNNYADATNMKEAIVYDMFAYLGADASLYNYAKISVNGEYWGVYLALEAVEDSFLLRNYGAGSGELYKPDSMNFGGAGGMKDRPQDELDEMEQRFFDEAAGDTQSGTDMQPSGDWGGKGFGQDFSGGKMPEGDSVREQGGGSAGADLNYIDDDLDSYSTIWEGQVDSTSEKDHARVVEALKNISQRNDLEDYMDVDNLLKYLAAHTFAVNLDSLSGTMAHNYYLYEEDGQLNLIPWDYNLAWGGFQSGSASSTINFPIDTPFTSGLDARDFFAALLENEEYLAQYHAYLQLLCQYVTDGQLETVYQRIRTQIDTLVETDPNAFYSYEEYDAAAQMLYTVLELRAQSVSGQIDGTIPATTDAQNADNSSLIDVSDIDLSIMGSMNNNGGGHQGGMDMPGEEQGSFPSIRPDTADGTGNLPSDSADTPADAETQDTSDAQPDISSNAPPEKADGFTPDEQNGTPPDNANMQPGGETGGSPNGTGEQPGTPPDGAAGMRPEDSSDLPDSSITAPSTETDNLPLDADTLPQERNENPPDGNSLQMPAGKFQDGIPGNMEDGTAAAGTGVQPIQLLWLGVSLLAIMAALLLAKCYRRRKKS